MAAVDVARDTEPHDRRVVVVGGGLAGCEAAWQAARRGMEVILYEMKPVRFSPAHQSEGFAELVCSNSLRSNSQVNAVGLLKEEMRRLGSLVMEAADESAIPAGRALAVDREAFSRRITDSIQIMHTAVSRKKNIQQVVHSPVACSRYPKMIGEKNPPRPPSTPTIPPTTPTSFGK